MLRSIAPYCYIHSTSSAACIVCTHQLLSHEMMNCKARDPLGTYHKHEIQFQCPLCWFASPITKMAHRRLIPAFAQDCAGNMRCEAIVHWVCPIEPHLSTFWYVHFISNHVSEVFEAGELFDLQRDGSVVLQTIQNIAQRLKPWICHVCMLWSNCATSLQSLL